MITPAYCVEMARYNIWQNAQLSGAFAGLEPDDLTKERGAFFGSILGTANHLIFGDMIWMSRLDGGQAPAGGVAGHLTLYPDLANWQVARDALDARILDWAVPLGDVDLHGELTWFSGAVGREVSKPRALCVTHMFNHQTHHRGQIHMMLTSLGVSAPVSDMIFRPQDNT